MQVNKGNKAQGSTDVLNETAAKEAPTQERKAAVRRHGFGRTEMRRAAGLTAQMKAFAENATTLTEDYRTSYEDIGLVVVPKQANISVSSAVVFLPNNNGDFLCQTIIFGADLDSSNMPPLHRQYNNEDCIISRPLSELDNATFRTFLSKQVKAATKSDKNVFFPTDAIVIPAEVDISLQDVAEVWIGSAVFSVVNAFDQYRAAYRATDLRQTENIEVLSAFDVNPRSNVMTEGGKPIVSDFTTRLIARDSQNRNANFDPHAADNSTTLVKADGILDFIRLNVQPFHSTGQPRPGLVPHLVVTDVSADLKESNPVQEDLMSMLLGVCSVTALAEGNRWLAIPDRDPKGRNLGALTREYNPLDGTTINTKAVQVAKPINGSQPKGTTSLYDIAKDYCMESVVVSMDCRSGDRNFWAKQHLVRAALGHSRATDVVLSVIHDFCKVQTNQGEVSTFDYTGPIFMGPPIVLPSSTFNTSDGEVDSRSIDWLELLNSMEKLDLSLLDSYRRATTPGIDNAATTNSVNQHFWRKVTQAACGGQVKEDLGSQIFRLTFHPGFLQALGLALKECGVGMGYEGIQGVNVASGPAFNMDYEPLHTALHFERVQGTGSGAAGVYSRDDGFMNGNYY